MLNISTTLEYIKKTVLTAKAMPRRPYTERSPVLRWRGLEERGSAFKPA
ncbi:MAG: hypothetical protein WBE89_06715 [Methyloceanibacter sp.]